MRPVSYLCNVDDAIRHVLALALALAMPFVFGCLLFDSASRRVLLPNIGHPGTLVRVLLVVGTVAPMVGRFCIAWVHARQYRNTPRHSQTPRSTVGLNARPTSARGQALRWQVSGSMSPLARSKRGQQISLCKSSARRTVRTRHQHAPLADANRLNWATG